MDLDDLMKFLVWIAFFALALVGLYLMLKRIGILQ